ncbi:MAG TPA: phosphoribosylanthranilate isomerase [Sedimenticola thiotaurini]|uniref:N-(5'-phosphoribosyl)anthranilate isomerase n=1 Tax=Sedimenticola thiotaurini TaxID=1543721 RepID=A0A831RL53_9GAMM|nr:phosphoribosylanthranilate isomerase [Sedimenticola thiotaurini]
MRTRVKICGITRLEDAIAAIDAGCDAIGLVFYPPSPRAVTPEQARGIVRCLPPFVTVTGLFVDAGREAIAGVLETTRIDLLQFHGNETPEQCRGHGRPWIKALRMREGIDLERLRDDYREASALLLDTYREGMVGGTGDTFDWDRVPADLAGEIILAGGLDPDNVERAIRSVRPYAVDVSGGVERNKGIKDRSRISAFMRGVMRADQ